MTEGSPTVCGWELGMRLKARREQLALTASGVAQQVKCAQAYISGVESGRVKLPVHRLAQLVEVYEIDDDEAAELDELRIAAGQRGWWHEYQYASMFDSEFVRYLGFEAGASHIRSYNADLINGFLQTADYAGAVIKGGSPYVRLTEVERRVVFRMARQQRVLGDKSVRLTAIINQGALLQQVGGPAVMRQQLNHVAKLMRERRGQIEVRVMPFSAGAHAVLGSPFDILSFASNQLPDLVWQETLASFDIVERSIKISEYVVSYAEAVEDALSVKDSLDLIRQTAKEMR